MILGRPLTWPSELPCLTDARPQPGLPVGTHTHVGSISVKSNVCSINSRYLVGCAGVRTGIWVAEPGSHQLGKGREGRGQPCGD